MAKGKPTPTKPDLPEKPKRLRPTQRDDVNEARKVQYDQQLAEWSAATAVHKDAMLDKQAGKKRQVRALHMEVNPGPRNESLEPLPQTAKPLSTAVGVDASDGSMVTTASTRAAATLSAPSERDCSKSTADFEAQRLHVVSVTPPSTRRSKCEARTRIRCVT